MGLQHVDEADLAGNAASAECSHRFGVGHKDVVAGLDSARRALYAWWVAAGDVTEADKAHGLVEGRP
ncbi:hypothetical protein D3C80_1535680 [compost metagenome]